MNLEQENYKNLTPFKFWTLTNFPFIEQTFDSLTNYELLCKLGEYLNNLEYNQNAVQTNMTNLYNYVSNYFKDLDVTEEINNKLDELASDGTLTNLISTYINPYINEQNNKINLQDNKISIINDKVDSATSGSPAGVYDTLAELQSADPDHSKIYLVLDDGKWYFWNTETSQWKNGGVYQSSVNPILSEVISKSTNIIKNNPLTITGYIKTDGFLDQNTDYFLTSNYIKTYFNKLIIYGELSGLTVNYKYINAYDKNKNFISGITPDEIDSDNHVYSATLPENTYYLRITNKTALANNIKIYYSLDTLDIFKILPDYVVANPSYLSPTYLNKNNITSIKDLHYNTIYRITGNVTSDIISDLPIYETPATLIILNGANNNGYRVYICVDINNNLYICFGSSDTSNTQWKRIATTKDVVNIEYQAFAGFRKFGVIGDSLSVGHMNTADGTAYPRNIYYSWGQYLARNLSNICLNFGFSGATTKSWYENLTHGYVELKESNNLCQAYIVGLGTNDSGTIGSIADIDWNDRNNNADSFYGNYAKILQAINEHAPQSKIFVLTIPYPRVNNGKNNAIREIASNSNLTNVILVDLANDYNSFYASAEINNFANQWHFTPSGYANIAKLMNYILNDVMKNNSDKFIDIFRIPYGSNDIIN